MLTLNTYKTCQDNLHNGSSDMDRLRHDDYTQNDFA